MKEKIGKFSGWFNDNIAGNPATLVVCILFVVTAYTLLVLQGYTTWNLSTGLFANDIESAYELISGTAAVVAVVAVHKTMKKKSKADADAHAGHQKEFKALHAKLDKLVNKGTDNVQH
jgi:hypothetical protein